MARRSSVDVQHRVIHTVHHPVVVAILAVLFHVLRNDVRRAVVPIRTILVRPEPVRIILRLDHLPRVDPVSLRYRKWATIPLIALHSIAATGRGLTDAPEARVVQVG